MRNQTIFQTISYFSQTIHYQLNNDLGGKQNWLSYVGGNHGVGNWITIPTTYTHLVCIEVQNSGNGLRYGVTINLREITTSGTVYFPFGHYTTNSDFSGGKVTLTKDANGTHVSLNSYYSNGIEAGSNTYIKVYAT